MPNKSYADTPLSEKKRDYVMCLVCGEGHYAQGKGDIEGFFNYHRKSSPCLARWNDVAEKFGQVQADETNALYEEAAPRVELVNQEIADLKVALAQERDARREVEVKLARATEEALKYQGMYERIMDRVLPELPTKLVPIEQLPSVVEQSPSVIEQSPPAVVEQSSPTLLVEDDNAVPAGYFRSKAGKLVKRATAVKQV